MLLAYAGVSVELLALRIELIHCLQLLGAL